MKISKVLRGLASACFLLWCASALAAPLRSPWDALPARESARAYACPAVRPLPRGIVAYDYYSDARKSVPSPARLEAYRKARAPYVRTMRAAEKAADFYVKTGSEAAAACVMGILDRDAEHGAMTGAMASNQSYYVQNWTVGALAITYLKVRGSGAGTAGERRQIGRWLARVAESTKGYFGGREENGTSDGRNNHLYWAGLAAMSAGIAADNRRLYAWGVGTYRTGVEQITPEGTLPLEMARGRRALHYHLFAAAPLVTMAELGEANGEDLYAANDGAIHRLVERCVAGLENNEWFAQRTGFPQDTPGARVTPVEVAWMQPYARHFPAPGIDELLRQAGSRSVLYLGGDPPP